MKTWLALILLLFSVTTRAGTDAVYSRSVTGEFDTVYRAVYDALEAHRFFVVFEPDIGANLSGFAKRWGEDYNRNGLEKIRSMVFCNAWYANQVSNADPEYLSMCPLHITVVHKQGVTSVYFVRPDYVAAGGKAEKIARELTQDVVKAIDAGLDGKASGKP